MPSPIEGAPSGDPQKSPAALTPRVFALCLLMCASLQIMENLLPRIPVFPWLKLGLSYVILLPFLLRYGAVAAAMLLFGRNLLTLVFAGQALTTFLVGTSSGCFTLLAAGWLARRLWTARLLGLAGVGMALATLTNLSQLAVAEGLLIRHRAFFFQLAPMLIWSPLSGLLVAFLARRAQPVLEELFADREENPTVQSAGEPPSRPRFVLPFPVALAALTGLFLLPQLPAQAMALAALLALSGLRGGLRSDLRSLLRAWPWFLYLAWLHLFLGDGEYLYRDWITRPGLMAFLFYGARLAGLILLGPHLALSFPRAWLERSSSLYARGLLECLPLLPGLPEAALKAGRAFLAGIRRRRETPVLKDMLAVFKRGLGEGA